MDTNIENINKKQYDKQYYKENKNKIDTRNKKYRENNKVKVTIKQNGWYKDNSHRIWAKATINNHRRKGFVVNIIIDELTEIAKNSFKCYYCDEELDWSYGNKDSKKQYNSPTLDRIDNEQFMNINNIQILCSRCNTAKGVMTHNDYIAHCKMITNKFNNVV